MISDRQLAANRGNARRSTGPKTEAGRQASSLNALKHGLAGRTTLLPGEDPAAYQTLFDAFAEEFTPHTASDLANIRKLADCEWRLRRIVTFETAMLASAIQQGRSTDPNSDPFAAAFRNMVAEPGKSAPSPATSDLLLLGRRLLDGDINRFTALARYESSLNREYSQAIQSLQSRPDEYTQECGMDAGPIDEIPLPEQPSEEQASENQPHEEAAGQIDNSNPFPKSDSTPETCTEPSIEEPPSATQPPAPAGPSFSVPPTDYRGCLKWQATEGRPAADPAPDPAA